MPLRLARPPASDSWYALAARYGVLLAPLAYRAVVTRRAREMLERDDVWIDRHGVAHRVQGISPTYARAIIQLLEPQAPLLFAGARAESILQRAGQATGAFAPPPLRPLRALEPLEWLHDQPLVRALSARASA